jgi:precorrin-2 C20-methyltransferase / precorrin-3B C17-methyltransferase
VTGRLHAVGVGPGDPELLTLKAARLIRDADVVAYHSGPHGQSIARSVVAGLIPAGTTEELLSYPVTTGETDHPDGYYGAIADFYDASAARLAAHLDAGREVVVLAEGDPLFYSSYGYLHDRLASRYPCQVVPGVTSLSATSAAVSTALGRHEDVLTVLPGTLPVPELVRRLAGGDAVMIMKLGRTYAGVREALVQSGRLAEAVYVERASTTGERVLPAADVDPSQVPYFSMIMVPGRDRRADGAGRSATANGGRELLVVGLGPGPDDWLTAEVGAALRRVDHVVGYRPYLDRITDRPGLTKHPSGNTVELERARLALDLALDRQRVAVVSGGDAGVFGMAAAVYEAAEDPLYAPVRVTVLPGVTAAQAVAARAGAPLGGDYAVLSLSDRRKPWSVIEDRLRAAAAADLVIALYNPASRSRTTQVKEAKEILLEQRSAEVPVIIGRDVGRPGEELTVTSLGDLDPDVVDMRCLLIIGASRTRISPAGVWTSRSVSDDARTRTPRPPARRSPDPTAD